MNWIEDPANHPLAEDDLVEVRSLAGDHIRRSRRRAVLCGLAFVLSCGLVYPFLAGHSLHEYWDSLGKYLLLVSMAAFTAVVFTSGLWWSAWQALRDVEHENRVAHPKSS
jgi:hypothetical protein